jgi:uracil-DNA glycosylase
VIVPVGSLATKRVLGISRLDDCIGSRFELGDAFAVPLPHPSGASGWLNSPRNRTRLEAALSVLQKELIRAGVGPAEGRTKIR